MRRKLINRLVTTLDFNSMLIFTPTRQNQSQQYRIRFMMNHYSGVHAPIFFRRDARSL